MTERAVVQRAGPVVALALLTIAFAVPFAALPFPFIDLYSNLSGAEAQTWRETLRNAFAAGIEYRPLLTIASKLAFETLGLELPLYKALVLLQFAGILGLLLVMFRPLTGLRAGAAVVALLCLAGLHSSRILFNFNPLNAHSGVLLVVLASGAAAFHPWARRREYTWFFVTLAAALALESGLLIVPVLAALRLAGAPGITWRGVIAATAAGIVYAVIHLTLGVPVDAASAYTHSGLGFSAATPERLDATFGRWPWLFWGYNVFATLFTVLFSEPREGTYVFVDSLLRGTTPAWMWVHVLTSVATTMVIVIGHPRTRMQERDRWITAMGLALMAGGSALGFLYTRDRIALPVGIGYAMLLYVALSALLDSGHRHGSAPGQASRGGALTRSLAGVAALIVAGGWLVRDAETYWFLRDLAWEHHREWSVRYEAIRDDRPETDLMRVLQALALETTPTDPTTAPGLTFVLLERKFGQADPTGR